MQHTAISKTLHQEFSKLGYTVTQTKRFLLKSRKHRHPISESNQKPDWVCDKALGFKFSPASWYQTKLVPLTNVNFFLTKSLFLQTILRGS